FAGLTSKCNGDCAKVLADTLHKKKPVKGFTVECCRKDRPGQIVTMTCSPLIDRNDKFKGAVLVIRDMTRLSNLEEELRERYQFQSIIGKSSRMQQIYQLLKYLADTDTTVLVGGESGTGKELVAQALHYSGIRAAGPMVNVNCSALSENLLESELFGHVKGAFTGAIKDKIGRFQMADGGTILLDEIGDISPAIQLKLLRILQEREFERVGDSTSVKVNVRVVAATNRDLKEKVRQGHFRSDLYYRLKVIEINLPPLREKSE
ncbi:MAG: AAA domain-containing protein, partial [Deltaproteobacteria bacterium]|nr:AAA domain-containing protein [Deltaproteobacteria bacterium]